MGSEMCIRDRRVCSRGAALQASVAKSCMPPKALSRFAERGEIRGHRHRRARWCIHSGQRPLHSRRYGPCSGHSGEVRDRLWRSGSRPSISSTHGPHPLQNKEEATGGTGRGCSDGTHTHTHTHKHTPLTHAHRALHVECRGAPVVRRGDARVAPPCPTTSCVWRSLPYLITLPFVNSRRADFPGTV